MAQHPIEHCHRPGGKKSQSGFATKPIAQLLKEQSIPASVGILAMSLNSIIDTFFVGNFIGSSAIAAITVVMPFIFLISSVGMAIGVGGSSLISQALGANDCTKALKVFSNQVTLSLIFALSFATIGYFLSDPILILFGAQESFFDEAKVYYLIQLISMPFLTFTMMGNPVIRAEDQPKVAMLVLLVPAFMNIILDYVFIYLLQMGMAGAAWASALAYTASGLFVIGFFLSDKSQLKINLQYMPLRKELVKEIASIGGVTLARQGTLSVLSVVLNQVLFLYGGVVGMAVFGIVNRMLMFSLFPIIGIMQGFMPIAGFNYGAKQIHRVKQSIKLSIGYASFIALLIFSIIIFFATEMVSLFSKDTNIIEQATLALKIVFIATPIVAIQLIGAAYFQALGKVWPALILTLTKQGIILIPLVLILPQYFGLLGVWLAFPITDLLSTLITGVFLRKDLRAL